MNKTVHDDSRWMRSALMQARFAEGRAAPNPAVGCVLVRDGMLVGSGHTSDGGRPHAETMALSAAGDNTRGATAYVTLEPCSHHGKTPPCADALVAKGIARVVIAMPDPDKRVAGQGIQSLINAGLDVITGVMQDEAEAHLRGYIKQRQKGRPLITVKIASSLDGRIALGDGHSQWITGARARSYAHLLRSRHDAIMTSSGTVRADNPRLTTRLPGYSGPQGLRVVVASDFALPEDSRLIQSHHQGDILLLTSAEQDISTHEGRILTMRVAAKAGNPDLTAIAEELGARGITSVLVEAGGIFTAGLLKENLVDKLIWIRSPGIIGGDGLPSISSMGLENLEAGRMFRRQKSMMIDDDMVEIFTASDPH